MLKYIGRRILMMIPILLAVTFVVFTLLYITPVSYTHLGAGSAATGIKVGGTADFSAGVDPQADH